MAHLSFDHAHAASTAMEVRVDRQGPGRRNWRWSIWRGDDTLIARSPAGFAGAEEAYEAGRRALQRPVRGPSLG